MWFFKRKKKKVCEKPAQAEEVKDKEIAVEAPKSEKPKKEALEKKEPKKAKIIEKTDETKAKKATYHVTKREDGKWQVKGVGLQKATKVFDTQKEAIDFSKKLSKTTNRGVVVHKTDGKIRKKNY